MSTTLKQVSIETIEIVKCTTGFIVYLHDSNGDIVATRAISTLGYAGYAGSGGSVLESIVTAFADEEGE